MSKDVMKDFANLEVLLEKVLALKKSEAVKSHSRLDASLTTMAAHLNLL